MHHDRFANPRKVVRHEEKPHSNSDNSENVYPDDSEHESNSD
jgi:hypothetical protein